MEYDRVSFCAKVRIKGLKCAHRADPRLLVPDVAPQPGPLVPDQEPPPRGTDRRDDPPSYLALRPVRPRLVLGPVAQHEVLPRPVAGVRVQERLSWHDDVRVEGRLDAVRRPPLPRVEVLEREGGGVHDPAPRGRVAEAAADGRVEEDGRVVRGLHGEPDRALLLGHLLECLAYLAGDEVTR